MPPVSSRPMPLPPVDVERWFGACERGFHQFCLEPPLLKEQVPPGDEGWLFTVCDCKVDYFELLWCKKGTGRARHGSLRGPHFRSGAVMHGPKPCSHAQKLNKQVSRRLGLKIALFAFAAEGKIGDVGVPDISTTTVEQDGSEVKYVPAIESKERR